MSEKFQWQRILPILPAVALSYVDTSILPVALSDIDKELGASSVALQWTVNAYLLMWAIFILPSGKFGDFIGHKKGYLIGVSLFVFTSICCGMSPNIEFLIAARGVQGFAAAIIFPCQSSLLADIFPPTVRGRAIGILVSIGSVFLILGPLFGGLIIEYLDWRWIFWVNVPIGLIGFFFSYLFLPSKKGTDVKIDFLGMLYFALFASSLTIFFMQANVWGWGSKKILFLIGTAFISAIFLLHREKHAKHPFMELRLFKLPAFATLSFSIIITHFILMITVFRVIYTEDILNYTPFQTGLITSCTTLPVLCFSYIAGYLSDRINLNVPLGVGFLLIILSFFWLGLDPAPSLTMYLIPLFLFGMGVPFIFTPSYSSVMSIVPAGKIGVAMGMIAALRTFSASMGLAIIYLFVDSVQAHYLDKIGQAAATIKSFSSIHYLLGVVMLVAGIISLSLFKHKSIHKLPNSPSEGYD